MCDKLGYRTFSNSYVSVITLMQHKYYAEEKHQTKKVKDFEYWQNDTMINAVGTSQGTEYDFVIKCKGKVNSSPFYLERIIILF